MRQETSDGRYGPRTPVVEATIDRAGRLTEQEIRALADATIDIRDVPRVAALARADVAVKGVAMFAVRTTWAAEAAWDAAYATYAAAEAVAWTADDWDEAVDAAVAARWAAEAAVVADLEGERALTREHLETLAGPWRQVIPDVDPLGPLAELDGDGR